MADKFNVSPFGRAPQTLTATVPIVGQPCRVTGAVVTALVECLCDGALPMLVMSTGGTTCPKCGKVYSVPPLEIKINIGLPTRQPDGEIGG